ncbi:MAG: V-type ATP synthase subunit B [Omnitrophica bacterium RIFCSPLOWO2_02_FULL_45_16]|nr:MAG: V-type ATP synthase subunit B [Omnitrophica bacterium RIFCSPHIGHO2_02_FULL_46_20]OGW94446.1 MAG: V-type ATP synthase subunit B [Omnitrophica bacterium RIFCSPLOWO2_12_FULL_45_13]OGW94996.1 MAG: V-type ATP synthase subunit B [Omnitrophica bacterium RIFCSPLOWO2_01_FULL_45_24]OGX00284.1 MAG: V-type ATP synthase subunit B [Omnitrophica bacterium RIFCSPLOWO2_02_FULL_45_16]
MKDYSLREYVGLQEIVGPIFVIRNIHNVGYNEVVEIVDEQNKARLGVTLEVGKGYAVVQVLGGTSGLSFDNCKVRFKEKPLMIGVSEDVLGRVFDGVGNPIDNMPKPAYGEMLDVNGLAINPTARDYPNNIIETGISSIDIMNTLVRGQKLPIFSGSGLSHDLIATQIARQARVKSESFCVVFAAMGVKYDVAQIFIKSFEDSGVLDRVSVFLSLADSPSIERILTPRLALTCAEFLAFKRSMHVLVIMTDMSNYCEALRELSTVRGEIPARKGYPGYLYSDLASLYERAGMIKDVKGSITQLPILTMPNDDITHPIPDLTGYITEGQIVLDRELHSRGIYPPIACLSSLSRLMKDNIGIGMTREDHPPLASQLFACYARVKDIRSLAAIVGEEELTPLDLLYIKFGDEFEKRFLSQGYFERRTIEEGLDLGWDIISILPKEELVRIKEEYIQKRYKKKA